ncbi:Arrestin-lik [Hirsutella rhossiliensis]|uniref:Arrestin-lik n=1 Tax=Hirsutella rhossiliensis TaxID=111463 RepID=A0A9P8MVM1_9HYPO|nr:Arrestin-lik [Hirsutella rhossiliensis]KAH0962095.1 Arrestin-lik [Hirsutella rhossiliensis]
MLCYRKRTRKELREVAWDQWLSSPIPKAGWSPFACRSCFREGEPVPLHRRLGCEHTFPDELKGLTPVEEKLIALNSCYGFHVKGHITVFPNNVMDEIHVSWQGALRPTPSDLSSLLSVRRRVVERALVWLKRNNPHYAAIEIDAAEMESWGDPAHGVPPLVYERLERNEPSAWEKTRTAHVVPPTERAMDDEGAVEIEEVLAMLNQGGKHDESRGRRARGKRGGRGMFALDGPPDVADVDKLRMLSVTRKNFRKVERIVRSLTADGMRHKILALIVRYGVPAIWFTINPNDITNPVKLRLAAYRTRDPEAAEEFLRSLDMSFKRVRLSVSDPMSSAMFFHREMTLFFEHYVNAGESVFGRIGHYYGAVETNERGSLHVHGLLWLHGNAHLSSMLSDAHGEEQAAYRERIIRYVDSVFCEDLDQEGFCAVQAERSVTSDVSSLLDSAEQFSAGFEEEANFCAGATQIHTHSPTCVKYSLGNKGRRGDLCRFKAPWKLVEETTLSQDGVLRIRRTHPMVNRWNKAIAVGLRHNHDISFIATQRKTMALVYYVTNYATKVEDPTWKRVAAAAELLPVVAAGGQPGAREDAGNGVVGGDDGTKNNKTRQFLMRVANRIFTERALSQVEVVAHLLGYPSEFTSSSAWAYLNVSVLYWHVSRRWRHLRQESGTAVADVSVDESVAVEEAGERISFAEAYHHRGHVLRGLCLYDYVSLVRLQRVGKDGCSGAWGEVPFESGWVAGKDWVQVLRRPGKHAVVCLDGHLSKDFEQDDEEQCHRRAAVQHLALFAPWRPFLAKSEATSTRYGGAHESGFRQEPRASSITFNYSGGPPRTQSETPSNGQRRPATGIRPAHLAIGEDGEGPGEADREAGSAYQSDNVGNATRLIDVVRSATGANQITAGSRELSGMMQQPAERSVLAGFGEEDVQVTRVETEERAGDCLLHNMPPPGLDAAGDGGDVSQLCQFVGGEGGTGKSRVIEALVGLFAAKDLSHRLLITATSGTAAARVNGITIHSACGFTKDQGPGANTARTSTACGCRGRRSAGLRRIPIVLFCGDFHQFRPVQERSILLPSAAVSWDEDNSFRAEQRHQHDKAHALWRRFTTAVMLDEQMRAAGDPELQRLLKRIRGGVQDHTDLDLLNSRCHREGRRIPWETGITVVTPLNRNRWNLNMEASLAFQIQQRSTVRIFLSEHKWKDGLPTEEEAIMMLNQGDDSAIPVPAVFMFVPGMPVVVNHNTHQGLKLVNGASYTAVEVIVDKAHRGIGSRPT